MSREKNRKPSARVPQFEITELTNDTVKFILSKTDLSMANALRRVMIAEVPTLAIETIEIEENTSPLFDEFLAHRIGLIPIVSTDIDQVKHVLECCAEGCDSCRIPFYLSVKNTDSDKKLVTTAHLKCLHPTLPSIKPSDVADREDEDDYMNDEEQDDKNSIVIAKLARNQELSFKAIATKGIGKEHAKYIPVSVAVFTPEPEVSINSKAREKLTESEQQAFTLSCPTKVFSFNQQYQQVEVDDELRCIQCQECVKFAKKMKVPDLVKVSVKPDKFRFSVESTGQHKPLDIVTMAMRILKEKLIDISQNVKAILSENSDDNQA